MEREEIFGAIIVLMIIVVIVLIVINMQGEMGGDIRRIADEVFGWTKQQQKLEAQRLSEKDAARLLERLTEIHTKALETQKTDCTYDIRGYDLPEKYKVEIAYLNSQDAVVKFNLLKSEDDTLIEFKIIDKKQSDWKLEPCLMEEATKRVQASGRIEITYSIKEGLKAGTENFYEDAPKFYKYDQKHLCVITKKSDEKYKKYFLDKKDCESDDTTGKKQAKEFFDVFMASVKKCKSFARGEACYCEWIDFTTMPSGALINGIRQQEAVKFTALYNNEQVAEEIMQDTKAGDLTEGFFQSKPTYREWTTTPRPFTKEIEIQYIALTKENQLSFATERAAIASGAFLRRYWAESLPQCAPSFYEVFERGCIRKLDPMLVLKRIQESGYDKIIKETTADPNEREFIAAIIATESSGINGRVSTGNCAGLMQFCPSTAKGFAVAYGGKTQYVCDPKGCQSQDNRDKPEIAIPAGLKLLKDKIAYIDKCPNYLGQQKRYTYLEIFGVAAYNGGEDILCKAIKATKKEDPTWTDIRKELDINLLKSSKGYTTAYWTKTNLEGKVKEIKCYPYYVQTYRTAFIGRFS